MTQPPAEDEETQSAGPAVVRDVRTGREYVSPYRYQRQFEAEFEQAGNRLIGEHGTFTEQFGWLILSLWFPAYWIGGRAIEFAGVKLSFTTDAIELTKVAGFMALAVTGIAAAVWGFRGRARFRRRLIDQRLCLECGYSLIGQLIDDEGRGRCPECGTTFEIVRYLRPPKRYHRAGPARQPARERGNAG
ncbi:MAG: hypothetical protein KJZ69_05625 [Phycisphaerales bacterium]|nr:hypothetical protein [Phycisphaerales bacterium]